jgi:hypothetical protein
MKNAVSWDTETRSYLTGNALPFCYRAQPVNVMKDLRFHGGDYKEFRLLGCYAVRLL